MSIPAGTRLGHYEILEPIGEGGMGEVYRAEDKRLGRHVALKVLRAVFSKDNWVLARFEQEARSVSALKHPNIVTIYDIGQADESFFFVMELIEGKSLREILQAGPLPIRRLLKIAVPMADGIACAHAAGIVHRDLKPENIMITRDDQVKILDFGIAKLMSERPRVPSSPTVKVVYPTEPGVILGTVGYMSPEQAKMEPADYRSDQFSFGAMLYEMAAGVRAFQKSAAVDTLSTIIHDEPPPLSEVSPLTPAALRWLIERCMHKDPGARFASTDDLARDLLMLREHLQEVLSPDPVRPSESFPAGSRPAPGIPRLARNAGAAVAVVLAGFGIAWLVNHGRRLRADGTGDLSSAEFAQLTFQPGIESFPNLSPDGKNFVFVSRVAGNKDVFLQRIGGRNAINLTADCALDDDQPAFSPDGDEIVFRSERNGGGLFLMGATGESVRRLTDFGFNPSWSPDGGRVVFASEGVFDAGSRETTSQLWTVNVVTGEKHRLKTGDAVQPSWSPHGNRIAYWGLPDGSARRTIWTAAASGSAPVAVTSDNAFNWNPVWEPDGKHLCFASDRSGATSLWRVAISEETGETLGPARPLGPPALWSGQFCVSRDGRRILYTALERRMTLEKTALNSSGSMSIGPPNLVYEGSQGIESLALSPDGGRIAFTSAQPTENLFLVGRDGLGVQQLTTDRFRHRGARWSPDGKWVSFHSNNAGGAYQIWAMHPDGSEAEQLTSLPGGAVEARWSADGSRLLALSQTDTCVFPSPLPGRGRETCAPLPKVNAGGDTFFANDWSPDGGSLAGEIWRSNGSEIPGIVTYSFASGKFRKLTESGNSPTWLADSRRLLFLRGEQLFSCDTRSGETRAVRPSAPGPGIRITADASFAISRDNRELYFVRDATQGDIWQMTIR